MVTQSPPLSNIQLELLKMFSYPMPEQQVSEIKQLLAKYFAEKLTKELDHLWDENDWTNETMDSWLNEHLRTSYQKVNL